MTNREKLTVLSNEELAELLYAFSRMECPLDAPGNYYERIHVDCDNEWCERCLKKWLEAEQ